MRNADTGAWRSLLEKRGLDPALAKRWSGHARPGVKLIASSAEDMDDTEVGISKFGGRPDLPVDVPWPMRSAYAPARAALEFPGSRAGEERPLAFLAQIDLRDVAKVGCDLPLQDSGLLLFFYDAETQPWGFDPLDAPGTLVLHVRPGTPTQRRADPLARRCPVKRLQCAPGEWLPHWGLIHDKVKDLPGGDWMSFGGELDKLSEEDHALITYQGPAFGGWPCPIQGQMELECETVANGVFAGDGSAYSDPEIVDMRQRRAEDWRLVLQLPSDDALGWEWGDCGNLYLWCREADIAAGRFDRCWTILQCT